MVLLDDELSAALSEDINLEASSDGDVVEASGAILVEVDNWGLEVGVVEVHSKEVSGLRGLNEQEGVGAERLEARRAIVEGVVAVSRPHLPSSFSQSK